MSCDDDTRRRTRPRGAAAGAGRDASSCSWVSSLHLGRVRCLDVRWATNFGSLLRYDV